MSVSRKSDGGDRGRLHLPAGCDPPGEDNPPQQMTWVIFGATGHMGRSLVRSALTHGDRVAVVGHMHKNTPDQIKDWHEDSYGLLCDVRVLETVDAVIRQSIQHFGRIDIIAK